MSIIYTLLLKLTIFEGYPKVIVLGIAGMISLIPIELGYLFVVAKQEVNSFNIFKILGLKRKLKAKEYIFYALLLFFVTGLLMTALKPLSFYLLNTYI